MDRLRCNLTIRNVIFIALGLIFIPHAGAEVLEDSNKIEIKRAEVQRHSYPPYIRLKYLRHKYRGEIFDFCESLHSGKIEMLEECLILQKKRKKIVLARAREKLGSQSRAQAIYDYCRDYHPLQGLIKIGICVDTRLLLKPRVDSDYLEDLIYQKCQGKWAKHGWRAVRNCCLSEGRYFSRYGELRD